MRTLDIFEQIAETGHAPKFGCHLFGVGYDDAIERLRHKYLEERFERGKSAEKFVVGTFGAGKTHFLRHLAEIAREMNCVTSEVAFNRDIDPSQSLIVYQEIARQVQPPDVETTGMQVFLESCLRQVARQAEAAGQEPEPLQRAWVESVDAPGLSLQAFGKVARKGLEGLLQGEVASVDLACRWLEGDVSDRAVAAKLGVTLVTKAEHNLTGRRALLSLLQFVRRASFRGTVIGFDEADQGLSMVDRKKMQRILSMFQSGINALQDLDGGSGLVLYAITPQIVEQMDGYQALQQRVADPGPGEGFFDGNTLAPKIDLTSNRKKPAEELQGIATKLVELFFAQIDGAKPEWRDQAEAEASEFARQTAENDPTSTARRTVAKHVCATLLRLIDRDAEARRQQRRDSEI